MIEALAAARDNRRGRAPAARRKSGRASARRGRCRRRPGRSRARDRAATGSAARSRSPRSPARSDRPSRSSGRRPRRAARPTSGRRAAPARHAGRTGWRHARPAARAVVERRGDQHLDDRLAAPAVRARVAIGAVHVGEARRDDDAGGVMVARRCPAAQVKRGSSDSATFMRKVPEPHLKRRMRCGEVGGQARRSAPCCVTAASD